MRLLLALTYTLTIKKIIALLQSYATFFAARFFKVDLTPYPPPYASIEPTNRCQLHCPECITGSGQLKRPIGDMTLEQFMLIIDKIYKHTIVLNLYMQGEPYLNTDLPKMIAYAKQKNLFVSLSTNGQRLPELKEESLPHHMIVSVDGATQEGYASYRRGGKLSKVHDFISIISQWKTKNGINLPYMELQFLLHHKNEMEVGAAKQLYKEQCNRFVVKSMQIINKENKDTFTPQTPSDNRYSKMKPTRRACYKMLSTAVFTRDGQLALCCMDKNANFVRGNILKQDYYVLLANAEARGFRMKLITKKSEFDICKNCPFA